MYQLFYAPDNASLIVRMVLEELDADYTTELVDRSKNMQQSDAYRALNPSGLIPVCVINQKPVFETAAIILALAEQHRELAPALNDTERPQFLKWLFYLSNSVHTDLRQLFYPAQYVGAESEAESIHRELALKRLLHGFAVLDKHCAEQEGDFVMDEEFTVVDIYLAVILRWAQLYPRDATCLPSLEFYPALKALCVAVEGRSGVQRACLQEGISQPFFDQPTQAKPSEGSAT